MIRLYLLFILSGFAGLVLETVFVRQLAWLFGNGTVATVVVLSAFMGGLERLIFEHMFTGVPIISLIDERLVFIMITFP